jgi:putative ABC transport system permease protein
MTLPLWRHRRERDLDEEIGAHLRLAIDDRIARGESPEDARASALRDFGNVGLVKEVTRDVWGRRWLEQMLRDARHAFRSMGREPGASAVLVITIALGIGANTAIFSVVHAVLIEPLPFREPGRLVVVWEENARRPGRQNVVSPANLLRWRERATRLDHLAALYDSRTILTGSGDPEELVYQAVTPEFFAALGVAPELGRAFSAGEGAQHFAGRDQVTVLSHELWQRRFAGDPGIVGRAIQLGGDSVVVVGVMPAGVRLLIRAGSLVGKPPDLWVPFQFVAAQRNPGGRYLTAVARLKPGVTLAAAQAQMDTIATGLAAEWPAFDAGWTVRLVPLHAELAGELRPALLVLLGAVGFVLLIACANVANLLLARGAARRREFAIRSAIGAGRGEIVRQSLTETLVLGLIGGAVGLLVARAGTDLLVGLSPVELTGLGHVGMNVAVLGFTAAASIVSVAICGFAPALEASRWDARDRLADGERQVGPGRRGRRVHDGFVIAQIALAVVLLVGAGLLIRSFARLRAVDPGFDAGDVLTVRVALPPSRYADETRSRRFFSHLVDRVSAIPGVRAAGVVSFLPFAGLGAATGFTVEGRPAPAAGRGPVVDVRVCDDGYFTAMRIPLLRGRLFSALEMEQRSDVVVVNAALARQYFPGEDPIGRRLMIDMRDPVVPSTIVGVVGDVRHVDLATDVRPMAYWPHVQIGYSAMTLVVRTPSDATAMARTVERAVRALDPNQPVSDVRTMAQWMSRTLARARFTWVLLAAFAGIALLLTAVGIYGMVSYSVNQRSREFGLRLALGALRRDIVTMVLRKGVELAAIGVAVGGLLALLLTRGLASMLYDVGAADLVTLGIAASSLAGVAVLASYLPARRAARLDAVTSLRQD